MHEGENEKREFRRKAARRIGAHCEAVRLCLDHRGIKGPGTPGGGVKLTVCSAGSEGTLEGSRPGEEGLISRSEIKARSPPQAAPSNSAARGGRQSQSNGYKPSL